MVNFWPTSGLRHVSLFSINVELWENFTKSCSRKLQVKKITRIFYWDFWKVCRWKFGRRVTTLFHWWCEWLSLRVFCLRISFSYDFGNPLRKEDSEGISTLKEKQYSLKKLESFQSPKIQAKRKSQSQPSACLVVSYLYLWWSVTAPLKFSS